MGLLTYYFSARDKELILANLSLAKEQYHFKASPVEVAKSAGKMLTDSLWIWKHPENALAFREESDLIKLYQDHADEFFCVSLQSYSSKGSWSSYSMNVTQEAPVEGPIAGITRASIKWHKAPKFWSKAPPAEDSLNHTKGCILAAGLGEAPYLRQATFTIWESQLAMDDYARSGAHLEAIRSAYQGAFFSESMFTRFIPINPLGTWRGKKYA